MFKTKLAKLNDQLFVDDSSRMHIGGEWYSSALCERPHRDEEALGSLTGVDDKTRTYLEDTAKGLLPRFVCAVPTGWIPEYDVFTPEGKVLARGWRSTLVFLAKKKFISLEKARRIFACSDLGLSYYDNASFEVKVRIFEERS